MGNATTTAAESTGQHIVVFYLEPFHGADIHADLVRGGLSADCTAGVPKTAQLGASPWVFIDLMQWREAGNTWRELRDDVKKIYWWKSNVRLVARFLTEQQIDRPLQHLRYLYLDQRPWWMSIVDVFSTLE